ncbi:MAG: site-2 protease family protein [Spirochaetes bacterium]|nr:site-2 protease family protein [Spirochaetota bacterium]
MIWFIIFFISAISHELAHGYAAFRLGDPTAKEAGRLTINPLKHIDPFGTILLPAIIILANIFTNLKFVPLVIFKPVPINPIHFKHPDKDSFKVALAGPGINLLYVLVMAIIIRLGLKITFIANSMIFINFIKYFGVWFIFVNLVIAAFNLIPIPPLDGSWILNLLLPIRWKFYLNKARTYIVVLFIILFISGRFSFIFYFFFDFFRKLTNWILIGKMI